MSAIGPVRIDGCHGLAALSFCLWPSVTPVVTQNRRKLSNPLILMTTIAVVVQGIIELVSGALIAKAASP
jgi:hypothetical protein